MLHRNSVSSPPQVLVIDDCEVARATMCELLREAGYSVLEQASAIGATRIILHHDIKAVLVDISMPGLSGDKLVSLLRGNPKLQGLVIVVVSARDESDIERLAHETGADGALSKGSLDKKLVPLLTRLLRVTQPPVRSVPPPQARLASDPPSGSRTERTNK